MAERLSEVTSLPRNMPLLILTGFAKCSVTDFVGPFDLMLNTEKVIQLDNYGDRHENRKFLERVKEITLLASNSFHSLNISNQWKIPSNLQHDMTNGKCPCENCSGKHYAPDFSHPRDKVKIKKAKEERADSRGDSGRSDRRQSDRKNWRKSNYNKDGDRNY